MILPTNAEEYSLTKEELVVLIQYYQDKIALAQSLSNKLDSEYISNVANKDCLSSRTAYILYKSLLVMIEAEEEEQLLQNLADKQDYAAVEYIHWYLKREGFNEVVIAGIIGNMMAEVGGQTLNLQYMTGSKSYFGVCQWAKPWGAEVFNKDLPEQMKYLMDTMPQEFNTYGYIYKKNFDYDSFKEMSDIHDAAIAFAKCYERCGSGSYEVRARNAQIAYNYFNKE